MWWEAGRASNQVRIAQISNTHIVLCASDHPEVKSRLTTYGSLGAVIEVETVADTKPDFESGLSANAAVPALRISEI